MNAKWRQATLIDLVSLQRGYDITKAQQRPGPYSVVSSSGVSSYHDEFKAPGPGVVIGRKGTLGTVFYMKEPYWPHDTTLWVTDFHGNDAKFAYYFLKTMRLEQFDVGAANPTLNRNHIHGLPIRIPDLGSQRRIADILSAYDNVIENNTKRIKILEEVARSVYREWFVNFRFPGHEKVKMTSSPIGRVPIGWDVCPFTDQVEVLSGGTPKTTNPAFWDGAIPFFTPRDAPDTFFAWETEKCVTAEGVAACNSRLYAKGTVFVTARGTVGKISMAGRPMAMNQSCYALVSRKLPQEFVLLHAIEQVAYLRRNTGGATFDTIVVDTFRRMLALFPPAPLVRQFQTQIYPAIALVLALQRSNANLRATRDLLLPRLITGKVPASVQTLTME